MNFVIESPDAGKRIDPPVHRILQHLPKSGSGHRVTVVPITRLEDFRFDLRIDGPWVLVDFTEFGWDWSQEKGHLWGVDRLDHEWFKGDEWRKMDDFILKNPPILTFQRELLKKDASPKILPIEYLNYSPFTTPDTKEQFEARPIDVLFNWGRSHESRPRLHADIFRQSSYLGYSVVSEWSHIEPQLRERNNGVWCAIHTPHFARIDVLDAIQWFNKAKVVVALNGCGAKTFRHGEIPNSIIALPQDRLAWSVLGEANCLRLDTGIGGASITHDRDAVEVRQLDVALKHPDLYQLYRASVRAADAMRPPNYVPDYIVQKIKEML